MVPRYEIRAVTRDDKADLFELARFLNSVNLPHDSGALDKIIALSEDSFSGVIAEPAEREYVFVLYDRKEQRAVGTSLIVAQLGRRDAPYIYFRVITEERYSRSVDKHFVHQVLSIGYSYDGPTEVGGLVMHPDYRRKPGRLGMQISYVRFLFMAMAREQFQSQVLAELLPPLEADGTSHLWEAVGRRFTDMDYRTADRLSHENKEFIRGLFPDGDIYVSLLPKDAQDVVGRVGRQTLGVEKLLRRIGFRYANRVDPFDGGPHFVANLDEITLVHAVRSLPLFVGSPGEATRMMVARRSDEAPYFVAGVIDAAIEEHHGTDVLVVDEETKTWLGAQNEPVAVLPL